ncbi:MAG: septum formation initiator family protein [Candidatus Veblenbacteria bacterium]|nr:septum formation initiator family protein [Candidatus Veblenbacteria bacterium]MDZ4229832.1 septum formation initiator family protein [Candidatus Veblenbacteria bacterium]
MKASKFWATTTSKFFLTIALLALAGVAWGVIMSAIKRAEIAREVQTLQQEIREHQTKNDKLEQFIQYLNTPEYQEREARLRLGLQKPGEHVVVIPGQGDGTKAADATAAQVAGGSNWRLWLNYFFKPN